MNRKNLRSLTLIELIVVLLVLVSLAGILTPQFGNMVGRTHGASGADNAVEISKAIQFFQATKLRHPNGFGVPIAADGTSINNPGATAPIFEATGDFAAQNLNGAGANENARASLAGAGITSLQRVTQASVDTAESATFGVEATTVDISATLAADENVVALSAAGVAKLGLTAGNTYVCLFVGESSELIGNGMLDAPLHFPEGGDGLPANAYARWCAIYQVDVDAGETAILAAVAAADEENVSGLQGHLAEYFEAAN